MNAACLLDMLASLLYLYGKNVIYTILSFTGCCLLCKEQLKLNNCNDRNNLRRDKNI